jgi:hypothetical protein
MKKYVLIGALMVGLSGMAHAMTPQEFLPDGEDYGDKNGSTFRKGSIGSLIKNVVHINVAFKQGGVVSPETRKVIDDMRASMPAQHALKVFALFEVSDWLVADKSGSLLAGVFYLQQYPQYLTPAIKARLAELSKDAHPVITSEIAKLV